MQELLIHAPVFNKHGSLKLLKDVSYPLVLGTKKLVQLQVKVINIFSSLILVSLSVLTLPIISSILNTHKNSTYPHHVKKDRKSTTSELQSRQYLVCRLLLEKKPNMHLSTIPH